MAGPLLSRVRVLGAKVETTPGTAETITATEAAFNVFDAKIQQKAEMEARPEQGGFGQLPAVPGARLGECTFSMELTGGSAEPGWASVFLAGCGLGFSSTKYLLDKLPPEAAGSTAKTLTLAVYENGLRKSIYGAMGNAKFTFTSGKKAKVEFTFTGIWAAPTDATILAPTYPTDSPLRCVSSALSVGSWTPQVAELTLDLGNEIVVREDSTTATGYSSAVIANRLVKGTMNPESTLVATNDLYGDWLSSAEQAFAYACSAGFASASFAATKLQFLNPQEGDRSGIQTDDVEFQLNADDLEVTFV